MNRRQMISYRLLNNWRSCPSDGHSGIPYEGLVSFDDGMTWEEVFDELGINPDTYEDFHEVYAKLQEELGVETSYSRSKQKPL